MKKTTDQEMKTITKKMASFFLSQFTAKELIVWQIEASNLVYNYFKEENQSNAGSFLSLFSCYLIPGMIEAKSVKDIQPIIEKDIVELFDDGGYKLTKKILADIGTAFLDNFSKLSHQETDVMNFMKHLSCFMGLTEMYLDYEFLNKQKYEEEKLKAA